MRISAIVNRAAQMNGAGLASNFQDRQQNWGQFASRVSRLGAGLRGLGVGVGERVAMLALRGVR